VSMTRYPTSYQRTKTVTGTKAFNHLTGSLAGYRRIDTIFDGYGNPVRVEDWGTTAPGDETTSFTHYLHNTSEWIISRPYLETLRSGITASDPWGGWLSAAAYSHDGQDFGNTPTQGAVTVDHQQLRQDPSGNPVWKVVASGYNNRGQTTSVNEFHVGTTTMGYNTTWGYQTYVDGPLSGSADRTTTVTDPKFGAATSVDPPDAAATTFGYDTLGRITSVTLPGAPSASYEFAYWMSGDHNWPSRVTTRTLLHPGVYRTGYEFVDGFGRKVQTQTVEGSGIIADATGYERTGRVGTRYAPARLAIGGGSLRDLPSSAAKTVANYDADRKVTTQEFDDGVVKATSWTRTVGHRHRRHQRPRDRSTPSRPHQRLPLLQPRRRTLMNPAGGDQPPFSRSGESIGGYPNKLVYSVDEAAAMLSIGRTLAYDLIRSGQLRSIKIGQRRLIAWADLDDFVEARRTEEAA